jgi:hypothetical protein
VVVTGNDIELPEVVVIGLPLLMVYVKVYGPVPPVPLKVIVGEEAFWHTEVAPAMVPVGD